MFKPAWHQRLLNHRHRDPTDDAEAAIVPTLIPAEYTAIVRGKNGTTGVALVEV